MSRKKGDIMLLICVPGYCSVKWFVNLADPVETLNRSCGDEHTAFIYQGVLLQPGYTFKFYDIKNMDVIIGLRGDIKEESLKKWQHVVENSYQEFKEAVEMAMNRKSRMLVSRRTDLAFIKNELRPRCYRSVIRRSLWDTQRRQTRESSTVVLPGPAESLPEDPLPVLWEVE